MKMCCRLTLVLFVTALASCASRPDTVTMPAWELELRSDVLREGAGNWIVIADAAFPVLSRTGVRTIVTDTDVSGALGIVLDQVERSQHVQPRFYLASELDNIDGVYAPGIQSYERELARTLHGHQTIRLQNRALMLLLADTKKNFQVLVVKTKTALPYSSLFIELDSGYWDSEAEKAMRDRMEAE